MMTLLLRIIRPLPGIVIKAVPLPKPQRAEGRDSRATVGRYCAENGYRSVLLVTDKTLLSLGYHEMITDELKKNGVACTVFDAIDGEPTVGVIEAGRNRAVECGADCIVALGGGSVMDSSKVIAVGAGYPRRRINAFLRKFVFAGRKKTLPLITVPSTAGTGAEITVGAVVKNAKGVKKSAVIVGLNVPYVVLDSRLTENAPQNVTVFCGIDALSHGLEGCLAAVRSSKEDIRMSRECVRLAFDNLPVLLEDPQNGQARQNMCLAAHYGGNAINRQLAGYVHAFAHTLGAAYHIPHGRAIAICLLPLVSHHRRTCADRLFALSVYCGFCPPDAPRDEGVETFINRLAGLLRQCGIRDGLPEMAEDDLPELTRKIQTDAVNYSSPKTLSRSEIVGLLGEIKRGVL